MGVVQYRIAPLQTEAQFWEGLEHHVRQAQKQGVELLVFPEYLTASLLALRPALTHRQACAYLDQFTGTYLKFFQKLSREADMMILAGTHIHEVNGSYVNEAFFFYPDGRVERQMKLHLTPEERKVWKLAPGEDLRVFDTPIGKTVILICYDIEFPELARIAAEQQAELILNPVYTDTMAGYYRVRHTAQARAVENQRFIVQCGMVGGLPHIPQIDAAYAQSGFFSPCDHPFPPDGVLALCQADQEEVLSCQLDLERLRKNWEQGKVSPFKDRKPELYRRLQAEIETKS
ncbi:carbon-nitrogen hydrolase family protein [Lihuaxuella thermophila]|uniref:carbon-nitrogen hydrolase family protein n=1 Tax=Lihuaxuella thermophila TaxID=1173111 RepID=UPI001FCE15F5|nr:carbon-nitrogen hydrolase family protein [Lihuaxuella thermophila]